MMFTALGEADGQQELQPEDGHGDDAQHGRSGHRGLDVRETRQGSQLARPGHFQVRGRVRGHSSHGPVTFR